MRKLLLEIKKYIEETEDTLSWELGDGTPLDELLMRSEMPDIYYEVLRKIKEL